MADKVFIGKVEVKQTQYGELIKISFGSKDRELLNQTANSKGWNNLTLKKGKTGNYYLEVDQYEPKNQESKTKETKGDDVADDLPF